MRNATTDLEDIKAGNPFTWGQVIKIHEIGEYAIAEYHPNKSYKGHIHVGCPDLTRTEYFAWLNGKSTSTGYESLDRALAGLIAEKLEGNNHRADQYFIDGLLYRAGAK